MMNETTDNVDALDVLLAEIVSSEQTSAPVLQIGQSTINYVNLTNNSNIEVNLVESDKKDIFIAPSIDEDAQKEAAHDSGASSTHIVFRDVYHDYKEQVIPIRAADNTIYAAGIGSVGILQNVIHVPNLQKQLLSISQICNQLNYFYIINGTKLEVVNNNNQEVVHTYHRNNGLYNEGSILAWKRSLPSF